MTFEIDQAKLKKFLKSGILVLSAIAIIAVAVYYVPRIVTLAANQKKELPIYCVDCPDKKVALSFDAAWGNEDTARILEILKKHKDRKSVV